MFHVLTVIILCTTEIASTVFCFVFQFFAMEHISKLALHLTEATLEEHNANLPKSFPLLVGWAELLGKFANNAWKAKDKAIFKQTLNRIYEVMEGDDEMDGEDGCKIVWQPYTRLRPLDQFLPSYCIGQQKMGMSRTILICFERFAYHCPDISPKQFGLNKSYLQRPLVELGRLKRWNERTKDLGKDEKHNTYKEEWDARYDCLICPPDYSSYPYSMVKDSIIDGMFVNLFFMLWAENHYR
ncbi:hypothetical protein RHGRI_013603 [Rhododendron griersonianum]|uniref:Uncharacterized protein n=1 Tax=Rhododendron griersonianum TaxID=479676 RepID=A0AAV6K6B8_9ERIC|nr:hypothetical protein RHGRI_013603 [Rhododendron griersonianum]